MKTILVTKSQKMSSSQFIQTRSEEPDSQDILMVCAPGGAYEDLAIDLPR